MKRSEFIKALDAVARSCNCDEAREVWLSFGVADGSTPEDYSNDEDFKALMSTFCYVMSLTIPEGIEFDGVKSTV